eukprot:scaffold78286_cov63-Phaeocystis_antarctica.AAC.3
MPARIADIEQLAAAQLAVSRCANGPVEPRCALERAVRSPRSRAREGSAWFFSAQVAFLVSETFFGEHAASKIATTPAAATNPHASVIFRKRSSTTVKAVTIRGQKLLRFSGPGFGTAEPR